MDQAMKSLLDALMHAAKNYGPEDSRYAEKLAEVLHYVGDLKTDNASLATELRNMRGRRLARSPIKPALTAEEWARGVTAHEAIDRYGEHAAIAVLNAALPDSDPRKITRHWVAKLRGDAADLDTEFGTGAGTDLDDISDALESYLAPSGATNGVES